MPYLIDSNWVIQHLLDLPEAVELLRSLVPDGIAVSIITYMESFQGTLRTPPNYTPERFQAFFANVPVLPISVEVAERCARIREYLGQQGRSVRPRALDLLIAATAIEHDLILVTRNDDDYRDIPDIELYRPPPAPTGASEEEA